MPTAHPLLRCLLIYRTMPWRFSFTFLLFLMVNASVAYYQFLLGRAFHDVEIGAAVVPLGDGRFDYAVGLRWVGALLGLAALRSVLQYVSGVASLHTGQELLFRLRDSILVQVQRLDMSYHLRRGAGEVIARTTRDADKVRDALISFWRNVVETGLTIAAGLGVLIWYDPWLALLPALLLMIGVALFVHQADVMVGLDRAVGDAYDAVSQDLIEGVGGVRVIKAFSLERARVERFERAVSAFSVHAASAVRYASSRVPLPQALVAVGQLWVLGVGVVLVERGELNVGELVSATLVTNMMVFRFEGIGRILQIFADARASAGRIMEFLDEQPAIASGQVRLPRGPLGVRLRGVGVLGGADGEAAILHGCDLSVAPGETVALVGATGSGKSTLTALLTRFLDPTQGEVAIGNDTHGYHDLRTLDLDDLRSRVHVASQDCFLFSDSVAQNLRLAAPDASDDELREALRMASALDIVEALPEGLDTRIGDRGLTLSGGQRQRLALARGFIANPTVLVLDDSTSALDAVTEQNILHNLRVRARSAGASLTLIVVASKPSTVRFADRVVVLKDGAIAAQGTHAGLAAESATYRELMGIDDGH